MSDTQNTNKPFTAASVTGWDVVSLGELASKMVWRLPGCSDLAIRMSLCAAWRQFCDTTEAWRCRREVTLTDLSEYGECAESIIAADDSVLLYKISTPASCHVKSVFSVYVNDVKLPNDGRTWKVSEFSGCGKIIEIHGWISDSAADVVKASYSIIPDDDGEEIPAMILRKYGPVIVSGAIYPLFAQDRKPWSDATMAGMERDNWNNGMSEAALDGIVTENDGNGSGSSGRRISVIPYGSFV